MDDKGSEPDPLDYVILFIPHNNDKDTIIIPILQPRNWGPARSSYLLKYSKYIVELTFATNPVNGTSYNIDRKGVVYFVLEICTV